MEEDGGEEEEVVFVLASTLHKRCDIARGAFILLDVYDLLC
jgi:hypothetical protein